MVANKLIKAKHNRTSLKRFPAAKSRLNATGRMLAARGEGSINSTWRLIKILKLGPGCTFAHLHRRSWTQGLKVKL